VRESVAGLLPGDGSVTPLGTAMVAVFSSVPGESTVAVTSNVTVVPTAKLTDTSMSLDPLAGQLAPGSSEHVHVTSVSSDGMTSVTRAPVTSNGPSFLATIV